MFAETFLLNTGCKIPMVGFGTYQIHGQELIHKVIDIALQIGYRHFDTAVVYRNEQYIGAALKTLLPKYNLRREDIFITSKLIAQSSETDEYVSNLVGTSLTNLQTEYIDLYLIHWPGVSGVPTDHPENKIYRKNTWATLSSLYKDGILRSIGVSNYTVRHLQEILTHPSGVVPAVNQVEWHPHYHEDDLLKLCRENNIFLQAYSSLGTSNFTSLRDDPQIAEIAASLGKTPAQVLLVWALQQNIGVIPKARSYEHISENFLLNFTIPEKEMAIISKINVEEKYAWDPNSVA